MDRLDKLLMLQIYEHYIKHLLNNQNEQSVQPRQQAQTQLQIKSVTLYIKKFSSCIKNAVLMYTDNDNNITNTVTSTHSDFYTRNESTNEMPWIKYTFPNNEMSLQKIVIQRPPCTDMHDAYIECRNNADTVVYKSNSITENTCSVYYTFHLPNTTPEITI